MTDRIKHHCGLALVRLRKPLSYYAEKYGLPTWGLDKLQLLMIKQRNRGQDGAGVAVVKFDVKMGDPYMMRKRSSEPDSTGAIFEEIHEGLHRVLNEETRRKTDANLKQQFDFLGELYLGHLRYGTYGQEGISACHPYVRQSNWISRYLALAGNFNLTNSNEILDKLASYGLHTVEVSDTLTVLEKIGHFLDEENERIRIELANSERELRGVELANRISEQVDLGEVMRNAAKDWDGGYAFAGVIGNGDAFVCRDPNGIRPAYYYDDGEEVLAMASERAALTTAFNVEPSEILRVEPGHVLVIKRDGRTWQERYRDEEELRQCTFERIYFSRGNDVEIYQERKHLGRNLAKPALDAVDWEVDHAVFSFIPNTAETAFLGLAEAVEEIVHARHAEEIVRACEAGRLTTRMIEAILSRKPRIEKAAHKDQKVRTFIAQDSLRSDLVSHVYDVTRGCVGPEDSLVVLDDSIVRGTTLRESIITMLSRLNPNRIVILSSAPPIKYPDCYGIDMSELGRFVAFQAAIAIVKERGDESLIKTIYERCKDQRDRPRRDCENFVRRIYDDIPDKVLSERIAKLVRPKGIPWKGELKIIYQTLEGLRAALPHHTGDWYFTGDYPTPGGYTVLNTAFINYCENRKGRSY